MKLLSDQLKNDIFVMDTELNRENQQGTKRVRLIQIGYDAFHKLASEEDIFCNRTLMMQNDGSHWFCGILMVRIRDVETWELITDNT